MSYREQLAIALARESESLLPSEFYDVRQEIKPKAGWLPMYALAGLAYVGCIVAFACIYVSESRKSYVDTQIFSYDNSGNDGYSCQMISKVTASYEVKSSSDHTLSYELVNVIESKSQFETDMQATNPCSQELLYFPGTAEAIFDGAIASFGGVAFSGTGLAYVMTVANEQTVLLFYNYSFGTYDEYYPYSGVRTNSVAAGRRDGVSALYLRATDHGLTYDIINVGMNSVGLMNDTIVASFASEEVVQVPALPRVLNDNHYGIYVMGNDSIFSVDIYGTIPAPLVPVYQLRQGAFHRAAVYSSTPFGAIKVYYIDSNRDCYVWEQAGDTVLDLDCDVGTEDVVVDAQDQYYFLQSTGNNNFVMVNNYSDIVGTFSSDGAPDGIAITPAGDRALVTRKGPPTASDQLAFLLAWGTQNQVVQSMTQFGAGFFTCADQLLTSAQYTPGNTDSYPESCRSNGVVGEVVYTGEYMFSTGDASAYALQHAPSHCSALYPVIADTISDLPPYSCSRNVHPSFLACFATAAANTQLIFQVVVFFSAILLTRLAPRFPPKETVYRGAAPPAATPMAVEMTAVIDKNAGNGNGGHDIENPMSKQL